MGIDMFFFDPESMFYGELKGTKQGLQQGLEQGYVSGQTVGYQNGYHAGWQAAITEANKKLIECAGYIQQHVADKKLLVERVEQQHALILEMKAVIDGYKAECAELQDQIRQLTTRFGYR